MTHTPNGSHLLSAAKVFVLNIVGTQCDDGSSNTTAAQNAAAAKAAEAAAKLKEWKEARAGNKKAVDAESP